MERISYTVVHPGWYLHDIYWIGVLVFAVHYVLTFPETLGRKKILRFIIPLTLLWFITYPVVAISALIHKIKHEKGTTPL